MPQFFYEKNKNLLCMIENMIRSYVIVLLWIAGKDCEQVLQQMGFFFLGDFHGAIAAAYQIEGAWNEGAKDFRSRILPILKLSAAPLKKTREIRHRSFLDLTSNYSWSKNLVYSSTNQKNQLLAKLS